MNICCGEALDNNIDLQNTKYDEILITLDKTTIKFFEDEGVFKVYDTDDERGALGKKKQEIEDLKLKLELKDKEIEDYEIRIEDLDKKIKNMEKILLMDEKEQQYIGLIGENNKKN